MGAATTTGSGFEAAAAIAASSGLDGPEAGTGLFDGDAFGGGVEVVACAEPAGTDELLAGETLGGRGVGAVRPPGMVGIMGRTDGRADKRAGAADRRGGKGGGGGGSSTGTLGLGLRRGPSGGSSGAGGRELAERAVLEGSEPRAAFAGSCFFSPFHSASTASSKMSVATGRSYTATAVASSGEVGSSSASGFEMI